MIAIESFRKFKILDIAVILAFASLWLLLSWIINKIFGPQPSYILTLLVVTFLMSFTVHLVKKAGSATLFYTIGALLTFNINDLGAIGMNKLVIFAISGILFELIFLILKLELKNIQLDIITSTSISAASVPITTGFLLSFNVALNMMVPLINLILLSFLVGLAGAVMSFMIWYNLKNTKMILKFQYMQ